MTWQIERKKWHEYLRRNDPQLLLEMEEQSEQEGMEGCLSIPNRHGIFKRPARVTVRATTRAGKPVEIEAEGLLAVAFCHEIDHLDGTMYIDKQEREVTDEELAEMQKENKE